MSKIRVNEITDLNDNLLWESSQGVGGAPVLTSTGTQTVAEALDDRDAGLRQELAAGVGAGKGALLVRGSVIYVDTIADLQALPTSELVDKQKINVGGSMFQYNSSTNDYSAVGFVSPFVNGGDMFGGSDCSSAIQDALNEYGNVVIPQGSICRCDTMIEVGTDQSLYIQAGASLVRQSANSASTDPVVWVKGSRAACFGDNRRTSALRSENRTPRGVLRLGHKDMTESHANITYSQIYNLALVGKDSRGRTDAGEPDVCLYMPNPQFSGLVSYFHSIDKIYMENANIGIWLLGWANGNIIGDLQGYRLGNTTFGGPENRAFIRVSGALDNVLHGAFFHQSENSKGLIYEAFDNTPNGGEFHMPTESSFTGMVFEQGGAYAEGLYATTTSGRCFFQFRDNVAGGNTIPDGFTDRHMLFRRSTNNRTFQSAARIQSERITLNQSRSSEVSNEKGISFGSMTENTTYDLFTVDLGPIFNSAIVEVHLAYRTGQGLPASVFKFVGMWQKGGSDNHTLTVLEYVRGGSVGGICEPQNGNRTLVFKAHSNGTGTGNARIGGFVRITGLGGNISVPLDLTESASSGTPLTQT